MMAIAPTGFHDILRTDGFLQRHDTGRYGYCATVSVKKYSDPSTTALRTIIHADGYNVTCSAIPVARQALQRSVELHY